MGKSIPGSKNATDIPFFSVSMISGKSHSVSPSSGMTAIVAISGLVARLSLCRIIPAERQKNT